MKGSLESVPVSKSEKMALKTSSLEMGKYWELVVVEVEAECFLAQKAVAAEAIGSVGRQVETVVSKKLY